MRTETKWENVVDDSTFIGFTYKIINTLNNKIYIGKKFLIHPSGKKSNWKYYKSSSKYLKRDINLYGESNFRFIILQYYTDYNELHIDETKLILDNWKTNCYNKNAGGKFLMDDDTKKKIQETFKRNGHPMKGKVHPNKGKHINSGHKAALGKKFYTNGIQNKLIHIDTIAQLSEDFHPGLTVHDDHKRKKKILDKVLEYNLDPKLCKYCDSPIEYSKKSSKFCSRKCVNNFHSEYLKNNKLVNGKNNPSYLGVIIHTPCGIFDTAKEAEKFNNVTGGTILTRCRNSELIINKHSRIPDEYVGKTWREVGYYFE